MKALLAILFSICFFEAVATHIVGGELNYRYLGNNIYEVSLTVYRDCYNGQAPFDNPASIGAFDQNGMLISDNLVYINDQQQFPNIINTPCLTAPTNVCYEVAHYVYTTVLPPIPGGYLLAYQRCCRNSSIVNLANVQSTGATYTAMIPDTSLTTINSNPVFNNWPPTFICKDAPFTFDHSAYDDDGDSLVYEITMPLEGADPGNPRPQPPNNPPYAPVTYLPPYSISNVFGGVPLQINSTTGLLTATPMQIGQFVYGVKVLEYRNGVYIGYTMRDFQVNVVPCPNITVASIFSPTVVCGSLDAHFVNNSYNASYYQWDFGDSATLADTSSLMNPVYPYPDTGDYHVILIAYSGIDPSCNDTAFGLVHVFPVWNTQFLFNNVHCKDTFEFFDLSYGIGGVANFWQWKFDDGFFSSQQNPVHVYTATGTYFVQLISSTDSSCIDTMTRTVNVLVNPEADFSVTLDTCAFTISSVNNSIQASTYQWNFGDGNFSSEHHPQHTFEAAGEYDITLLAGTDSLCFDSIAGHVSIPLPAIADFSYDVPPCDSNVHFTNLSALGTAYEWHFGDGTSGDEFEPVHTYSAGGYIPVTLIAQSVYGCNDTIKKDIFFVSFKEAEFSTFLDTCSSELVFRDITKGAVSYHWDFGDGTTSDDVSPKHHYKDNGTYEITLIVNRETSCLDSTLQNAVFESPLGEILFVPNSFTPNGDGINDFFSISVYRPCLLYEMTIYDRWGEKLLYNENAADLKWDGIYKGDPLPQDVYVYLLKSDEIVKTGIINLVR
jgi:gliding motility-associated-like protein